MWLLYLPTLLLTIMCSFLVGQVRKRWIEDRIIAVGKHLIRRRLAHAGL